MRVSITLLAQMTAKKSKKKGDNFENDENNENDENENNDPLQKTMSRSKRHWFTLVLIISVFQLLIFLAMWYFFPRGPGHGVSVKNNSVFLQLKLL